MKVYIWYPSVIPIQVGHTALTLDDGTHISWWTQGKLEGKKRKKNPRDIGSIAEDIRLEGRQPDKTFKITGLNEKAIKKWWEDFLDADNKYNLATMNCCHVVTIALRMGGFRCRPYDEILLAPPPVESLVKDGAGVTEITYTNGNSLLLLLL